MNGTLNDTAAKRVLAKASGGPGLASAQPSASVESFIQATGHASQAVARVNASIYPDASGADLRVGPYVHEKYCKLFALYIAYAAIDCAFWAAFVQQQHLEEGGPITVAAQSLLEHRGSLVQRLKELQTT